MTRLYTDLAVLLTLDQDSLIMLTTTDKLEVCMGVAIKTGAPAVGILPSIWPRVLAALGQSSEADVVIIEVHKVVAALRQIEEQER